MAELRALLTAALFAMTLSAPDFARAAVSTHSYPRLMAMNIARPIDYDRHEFQVAVARADVVILGFWRGWDKSKKGATVRRVVRALKERNPQILIGQYTILNEARDVVDGMDPNADIAAKISQEDWWLRDANGERVRWTVRYGAYDVNATEWTVPDRDGLRYPEWLALRNYRAFFKPIPDFDIWYFDNSLSRPPVKRADWDRDGRNDSAHDPRVATAYRLSNVAYWKAARALAPKTLFLGNSDDVSSTEYSGKLQGVFLEALIGRWWSTETIHGWAAMMARYRAAMRHTAAPHLVGFNVWGRKDDYKTLRYALTSCLLDDGYFSYTDEQAGYGSVAWFDEFDVDLGKPIDPPPTAAWSDGVFRRNFDRGLVLVNPSVVPKTVVVEPGYQHISGKQAPKVNNGQPASVVSLQGHDGIILLKSATRTTTGIRIGSKY